jgi:hypothetical protein
VRNVDISRRRVRVEESVTEVGGRLVFGPPKTCEARTVIVPQFVIDRIAPLVSGQDRGDLVFTAQQGGTLRLNTFRRRVFGPAAAAVASPTWCHTIYAIPRPVLQSVVERPSKLFNECLDTRPPL